MKTPAGRATKDTAFLGMLEDSVRANGALGTDRHKALYHYVRGLRLEARQRPADAAVELRAALADPQETHVRIYLELAHALIAAGRSADAVGPLRVALKGPTSAAGLYATRSELQEMLGRAYELNGQPDSARAQYRLAADAWKSADPEFAARRANVEMRLSRLASAH